MFRGDSAGAAVFAGRDGSAYSDGSRKGRQSMNFRVVGGRWAWLFITRPTER